VRRCSNCTHALRYSASSTGGEFLQDSANSERVSTGGGLARSGQYRGNIGGGIYPRSDSGSDLVEIGGGLIGSAVGRCYRCRVRGRLDGCLIAGLKLMGCALAVVSPPTFTTQQPRQPRPICLSLHNTAPHRANRPPYVKSERGGCYTPQQKIFAKVKPSDMPSEQDLYQCVRDHTVQSGKSVKFPALYTVGEQSGEDLCDPLRSPLTRPLGRVLTYPSVRCGSLGR